MRNQTNAQQLNREKLAFTYSTALEDGDFGTITHILVEAERDPVLEQMLLELNEAWEEGMEEAMIQEVAEIETWIDGENGRSFNLPFSTNWRHYIRPLATTFSLLLLAWFGLYTYQIFDIYSTIPDQTARINFLNDSSQAADGYALLQFAASRPPTLQERIAYQAKDFMNHVSGQNLTTSESTAYLPPSQLDNMPANLTDREDSLNEDGTLAFNYQVQERLIIRNGTIVLEVNNTRDTRALIEDYVAEMSDPGGFVVNSNEQGGSSENPRITMNIRVPSTQFDETMIWLESNAATGTNPSRSESAEDVTEQYVDLAARLESMEVARDRLLDIMENAHTTKDLLEAEEQLTQREAEIEAIQGRMQFLQESSALSLIEIYLNPYILNQPVNTGWRPAETVRRAFDYLIENGQNLADFLIFVTIGLLPFVLLLIFVMTLIYRFIWKRFNSQSEMETVEIDSAE